MELLGFYLPVLKVNESSLYLKLPDLWADDAQLLKNWHHYVLYETTLSSGHVKLRPVADVRYLQTPLSLEVCLLVELLEK